MRRFDVKSDVTSGRSDGLNNSIATRGAISGINNVGNIGKVVSHVPGSEFAIPVAGTQVEIVNIVDIGAQCFGNGFNGVGLIFPFANTAGMWRHCVHDAVVAPVAVNIDCVKVGEPKHLQVIQNALVLPKVDVEIIGAELNQMFGEVVGFGVNRKRQRQQQK